MTKCIRKITALLLSAAAAVSAFSALPAAAVVPIPVPPDWMPDTLEEVYSFLNTHGWSYCEGGWIGIVYRDTVTDSVTDTGEDFMGLEPKFSGTMQYYDAEFDDITFIPVTEEPEYPKNGTKAQIERYENQMRLYEETQRLISMYGEEHYKEKLPKFRVLHIMAESVGDLEIELITYGKNEKGGPTPVGSKIYTFTYDGQDFIETDFRGWLPDCTAEFNTYLDLHSPISVHDHQIVVCNQVNYSTGADLISGTLGIPCDKETHIIREYSLGAAVAGSSSRSIDLYTPQTAGRVDVTVFVGRIFGDSPGDLSRMSVIAEESENGLLLHTTTSLICDLNADGSLNVADLIILSKFLTAQDTLTDIQMVIADYNEDKRVNAKDLSAVKRLMLSDRIDWPILPDDPIVIDNPIVIDDPVIKPIEQ